MIFFVGFVEEIKEILSMVLIFQNIVYVGRDLAEKVVDEMFKNLPDLKINLIYRIEEKK
jgi:hypothetical protein